MKPLRAARRQGRRKAVKVIEPKQPAQEPAEEKPKPKLPFYEQTLF